MPRRITLGRTVAAAAAIGLFGAGSAQAAVTYGHIAEGNGTYVVCANDAELVGGTGAPSSGVISELTFRNTRGAGTQIELQVLRPAGIDENGNAQFQVLATVPYTTVDRVGDGIVHLPVSIPVQAGATV